MFIGNGFTWINPFLTCERTWQNSPIKTNFTVEVEWNDKISQVSTGDTSQQTISVDVVLNLWHQGGNELTLHIQNHNILGKLDQYHSCWCHYHLAISTAIQQPWYWLNKISWTLSSRRKDFYYLYHFSVEQSHEILIYVYILHKN